MDRGIIMALIETLFSEYPDGAPADWTDYWSTGDFTATVESNASGDIDFGTKWLKYETNADDRSVLTWDDLGSMSDVSVLAKIRVGASAETNGIRLFLRVGGADTTEDSYHLEIMPTVFRINKYVSGSGTILTSLGFQLFINTEYWIKFQAIGTALKAKIWDASAIEPYDWHLEVTDTSHASGYVGIGAYDLNQDFYLDYFGVDTTEVSLSSAFLDDLCFSATTMPTTNSAFANGGRAMGGYFTESDRKLKGVGVWCKATHADQIRVAVYSGGDLTTGPQGSTLLKDFGLTSGSAVDQWIDIMTADDISIPINAPLWIVIKGDNASGFNYIYTGNSAHCGDFQITRGRTDVESIIGKDPDVAFASTFPAGTDTFFANWYGVRIILDQQGPVGWTGKINGVTNPAKINGVAVADIAKVIGQS